MGRYIFRRLLQVIPLVFGITFLTYAIVNSAGDPLAELELNPRIKAEDIERYKASLGLDEPWYTRYFIWVGNVLQGDLGRSMINFIPVRDSIMAVLPNTILLTGTA